MSLSNNNLNNKTVALASPNARCLLVIGIPNDFTSLPSLYEGNLGIKDFDNSIVHNVALLNLKPNLLNSIFKIL